MDLILLLGAHRTGSTALERVLARNEGALGAVGLGFWPQEDLRQEDGFNEVFALARRPARDRAARAALEGLGARLASRWQAQAGRGTRGLLLSEENMLGHMAANLRRGVFYPQAAARLRAYAALLPAPPRRIGLGIRSYADCWVSAYRYCLPRHDLPEFADLRDALALQPRGWCDLVTDIASVFPGTELLVWPQEALGAALPAIAARLIGYPADAAALDVPARRVNAAPQAGDAALIHALRRDRPGLKGPDLELALAPLRGSAPADADPAEAQDFTPAQRRALDRRYALDLDELADGHAGACLIARPAPRAQGEDTGEDTGDGGGNGGGGDPLAAGGRDEAGPGDERQAR